MRPVLLRTSKGTGVTEQPPGWPAEAAELAALIREDLASIIGPVRQELLSGVSSDEQFQVLREALRPFPDIPTETLDYEEAAALFNRCRSKGVQGSNTDFLICALAIRHHMPILTTDENFTHFARVLPIQLHSPRKHTAG